MSDQDSLSNTLSPKIVLSERKSFNLNLLPPINLKRVDSDQGRYYLSDSGKKLRSITAVLSKLNADAIARWRQSVGEEEANKISSAATSRGTAVHSIAERYVLGEADFLQESSSHRVQMFSQIKQWLDANVDVVLGVELKLASERLAIAGTCDLVCQVGDTVYIVDYKTASKDKRAEYINNYFLQCAGYSVMLEESYSIVAKRFAVIVAVEFRRQPQVFDYDVSDFRLQLESVLPTL